MDAPFAEWNANVRLIVEAFADESFQRQAWYGKIPTAFGSPGEMMCVFFDDLQVPEFVEEHATELGVQSVLAGRRLVDALNGYEWPMEGQFIDAEALLAQEDWESVRDSAKHFLKELDKR